MSLINLLKSAMNPTASAKAGSQTCEGRKLETTYHITAYDKNGNLKWEETFKNLVVNEGLNDSLDKHLKGSAYTAAWYVGLTAGTPTPDAGDTMAVHAGWTKVTAYSQANRPALTLGAVSGQSVNNTGNEAEFTINANNTVIGGAFITSNNTKGGTTGILYGVGAFTAGDKTLDDLDTLKVTVTLSASAT